MSETPGSLAALDHSGRWGIAPMVSDVESRGFGVETTPIQSPDRRARLLLVMTRAGYGAVSTGQWDAVDHATPDERAF